MAAQIEAPPLAATGLRARVPGTVSATVEDLGGRTVVVARVDPALRRARSTPRAGPPWRWAAGPPSTPASPSSG
jgi:hypothetical protein